MNKYVAFGIATVFLIVGGWWYLNQTSAPGSFNQLTQSDKRPPRDAYPYYCNPGGGGIFIIPSVGMSTLLIQPIGGTTFPSNDVVVRLSFETDGTEIRNSRYEGDEITLTGKGEEVTLSSAQSSITCVPFPHNDFPSLNFGD